MMNKSALIGWTAGIKRLFQRIQDKICLGRSRRFPADNAVCEGIDHEGDVNKSLPR